MIPKKIHYCWFGDNEKNELIRNSIKSWKKYCPGYEIFEWNENNLWFDLKENAYAYEALQRKKWAFVSDYVRLKALYEFGGVYLDTDVELCNSLGPLMVEKGFIGFEDEERLQTGVIGASEKSEWIDFLLNGYTGRHFIKSNGEIDTAINVLLVTERTQLMYNELQLNGQRQRIGDNILVVPFEVLCAKDWVDGEIKKTNATIAIHHFTASWQSDAQKFRAWLRHILAQVLGRKRVRNIIRIKDFLIRVWQ